MVSPSEVHSLIDQGRYVFPLRPRSKHPLGNCDRCGAKNAPCQRADVDCPCWAQGGICHGFRAATRDHATADRWWHRWATANVGISTGPSGLVVVDLDVKATTIPPMVLPEHLGLGQLPGSNGAELFGQVARRLSGADRVTTRTIRTPSGGYHCYFQSDVRYRSSKGTYRGGRVLGLGWSIDVRAVGGYVVAAGSSTRDGAYTVVRDLPILPVTAWLAEWLTSTGHREGVPGVDQQSRPISRTSPAAPSSATRSERYAMAALQAECAEIAAMAPESGRNDALFAASMKIGGFVPHGLIDEQTVRDALTEAGRASGLTPSAVERTVKSGMTRGMASPRKLGGAA